ncbi:MAG: hypothetical protein QTN59_20810 [Candidatus Electrothrix communis]|nr:hypothetical protein [Desulfobulbus sp. US4]WLE97102.1 MAG: hypothetical protein QTN59_20810 [Candidatus Electrothrix communis]
MSGTKSLCTKATLLLTLATFTFSAHAVSAMDVPVQLESSEVNNAMGQVMSSAAVKNVMIAKRDTVIAEKIQAKPLINDVMPKIEAVMMPAIKEKILPEKMAGLQNEMVQKIAPQF